MLKRAASGTCPWYEGPSLIEYLDALPTWDRPSTGPFRMAVSEKSKDMGTLVSGKIESGQVERGETLLMMPNKRTVEVIGIYFEEAELKVGKCGQILRLKLRGIEEEEISVGFVLCSPENPIHVVTKFHARLQIIDTKNIISSGYTAVLHVHTLAEEVTLSKFLYQLDPKSGEKIKKKPTFLKQGQAGIVVIECTGPICLETYKDHPQLGRFSLRDEGKTVALGTVLKLCIGAEDPQE